MLRKFLDRLTYANVMATVAVFIAIGGGAYAAGLAKNSVGSKQIKAKAVKNAELASNAVTSSKVADGSLLGEDFAAGQLPKGEPGQDATNLFAAVGDTGNLLYGTGAVGASRSSTGNFSVQFNTDLTNCVAFANSGTGEPDGDFGSAGGAAFGVVNDIAGDTARVSMIDGTSYIDRAFEVAVFCP
jgi:hypothetical protein